MSNDLDLEKEIRFTLRNDLRIPSGRELLTFNRPGPMEFGSTPNSAGVVQTSDRNIPLTLPPVPEFSPSGAASVSGSSPYQVIALTPNGLPFDTDPIEASFIFTSDLGITPNLKCNATATLVDGSPSTGENVIFIPNTSGILYPLPVKDGDSFYGAEPVVLTGTSATIEYELISSGGGEVDFPFRIQLRNNGTTETPDWQFLVNGKLRQNFNPNSTVTITDNNTWITITTSVYIWLELNYNSAGGLTSSTIEFGAGGWSTYPTAITVDSTDPAAPFISRFHLLIGSIVFSGSPSVPSVDFQSVRQNLRLVSGCDNGNSIRYPQEDGGAI